MTSTAVTLPNSQANANLPIEGEFLQSLPFSAEEILDFIARNTTLHKQVELLYVPGGYEAAVTYDHTPQSPVFKGTTVQDALCALMQGVKALEQLDRLGA